MYIPVKNRQLLQKLQLNTPKNSKPFHYVGLHAWFSHEICRLQLGLRSTTRNHLFAQDVEDLVYLICVGEGLCGALLSLSATKFFTNANQSLEEGENSMKPESQIRRGRKVQSKREHRSLSASTNTKFLSVENNISPSEYKEKIRGNVY